MSLLDDFMVRAILAGVGVAIAAAPLGSFVVWRRMVYFGDATSHASILGVALSLALELSVFLGVVTVALVMAIAVTLLSRREYAMEILKQSYDPEERRLGLIYDMTKKGATSRKDLISFMQELGIDSPVEELSEKELDLIKIFADQEDQRRKAEQERLDRGTLTLR